MHANPLHHLPDKLCKHGLGKAGACTLHNYIFLYVAALMDSIHRDMNVDDERIRSRLNGLQNVLESSMKKGGDALVSFQQSFDDFLHDCSSNLHEETHSMVHSFVQVVRAMVSALLEINTASELIHEQLDRDIRKIEVEFPKLSIHDRLSEAAVAPLAPYIEPCYKWLLNSLDNPYPSRNMRSQISVQTGAPEKDIAAWFIDARKRIGWNGLRRARFQNRADMIKAAARFFKPSARSVRHGPHNRPTQEQLDSIDYSPEFASIEDRARNLYSDKFFPTTLATEVTAKVLPSYSRSQSTSVVVASKLANTIRVDPALSYPSPERSPNSVSDHIRLPPSRDQTPIRSRKRKNSSVEPEPRSESESHSRSRRPPKRSRITSSQAVDQDATASLPSPAASIQDLPAESSPSPSAASPRDATLSTPSQKRQRSPSDTDDEQPSRRKRQRHLLGVNHERSPFSPSPPPSVVGSLSQERDQLLNEGTSGLPPKDPFNALTDPLLLSTAFPLPSSSINASAPSPALSDQPAVSLLSSPRPSTLSTLSIPITLATNSTKRKRRLSDADDQMRAKRPHNAMVTPRHQTVSDPFPISKPADSDSFAHWWQECIRTGQEIDMAETAMPVVETLDESTPLDVHYENYNYADFTSSMPEFNQWSDYAGPLMGASLSFPDTPVDQPFTGASENMGIQHNLPDFENTPLTSQNSAFNANADEFSAPYSNTNLFLPDTIDQTTGMPLFADLDLAASWSFDEFITGPQRFENNIPQFTYDFTPTIPQCHDALAYTDKLAKQRRVERLQEELRLAQAELAL